MPKNTNSTFILLSLLVLVACGDDPEPLPVIENGFGRGMIQAHANYRQAVGIAEDLIWSDQLETEAQAIVDEITANCADAPPISTNRGVNQFFTSATQTNDQVVMAWGNGRALYDYDANECDGGSTACNSYLQVVWADAKELGCAKGVCSDGTQNVWICLYDQAIVPGERPY